MKESGDGDRQEVQDARGQEIGPVLKRVLDGMGVDELLSVYSRAEEIRLELEELADEDSVG